MRRSVRRAANDKGPTRADWWADWGDFRNCKSTGRWLVGVKHAASAGPCLDGDPSRSSKSQASTPQLVRFTPPYHSANSPFRPRPRLRFFTLSSLLASRLTQISSVLQHLCTTLPFVSPPQATLTFIRLPAGLACQPIPTPLSIFFPYYHQDASHQIPRRPCTESINGRIRPY